MPSRADLDVPSATVHLQRAISRWLLFTGLLALQQATNAQCSFYTVTMEDGDGDTEITWSLVDQNGVIWASAGAPYEATLCLPNGCYTLLMYDSGGNGWDGLEWDIDADDSNWDQQATLIAGSQGQVHFATEGASCADASDCAPGLSPIFIEATPGGSPNQMSWILLFNGVQVSSGGSDTQDTLCLPPGCLVLQQFDSGGNGWQTGTVRISDSGGATIYNGTLASGSIGTANIAVNGGDCANPGGSGPGDGGSEPGTGPGGGCGAFAPGGDCALAGCACDPFTFSITPSGSGNTNEVPAAGTFSNPAFTTGPPWGGTAPFGCLLAGELNSTWIVFTVATTGVLQFAFGANGQQAGFYDWAMWPYNGANTCTAVATNGLAPVRCVWNATTNGGTGIASPPPPGGNPGNYGPPLNVVAGQQFIICLSNWSFVNANVTLDFFGTATIQCGPPVLPIEMLSFAAQDHGSRVHTQWITGSEHDNHHFEVERSVDGEHWASIGSVPGGGNSPVPLHYAWDDEQPLFGWSYYRLRQVDQDGTPHFSQAEVVFHAVEDRTRAWPQPSSGEFNASGFQNAPLLLDALGRLVPIASTGSNDEGTWHIRMTQPRTGLYTLVDPDQKATPVRVAIESD